MNSKGERAFWSYAVTGLLLQIAAPTCLGKLAANAFGPAAGVAMVCAAWLVGAGLLVKGLSDYSKYKLNRSPYLGLFGLLSLLGVVILMCLDRKKEVPPPAAR